MTDIPTNPAFELIEDYLADRKFTYAYDVEDARIDIPFVMGTYGTHEVEISAHEDGVLILARLAQAIPYGSDDIVCRLAEATDDRVGLLKDGSLEWALALGNDEIADFDDVQDIISCLSREVFLTEAILDTYNQQGRVLDLCAVAGFGYQDEYDGVH